MSMFGRKLRTLSRLMAGLFAVQLLAAGLCLLTPSSHMAMAQESMATMQGDMAQCSDKAMSEHHGNHKGACAHCDQPDELLPNIAMDHQADVALPMLALVSMLADLPDLQQAQRPAKAANAPPGQAAPLYQTTRRIRI